MKKEIINFVIMLIGGIILNFTAEPHRIFMFYCWFAVYVTITKSTITLLQERIEDLEKGEFEPHKYKK